MNWCRCLAEALSLSDKLRLRAGVASRAGREETPRLLLLPPLRQLQRCVTAPVLGTPLPPNPRPPNHHHDQRHAPLAWNATPCSIHSRRPNNPSCGRMNTDWPSLRLMSVYRAEAMVASGVFPVHFIRPRLSATRAISPASAETGRG